MAFSPHAWASQTPVLAVVSDEGSVAGASESLLLGVYSGDPVSPYAWQSQGLMLAVIETLPEATVTNASVSEFLALGVYGVGATEDLRTRAWGFILDGHKFYVIHLGEQGSWIYDFTTGTWSEWETAGYTSWSAEQGLMWDGRIIAGGRESPIIWEIDPDGTLDEGFKDITRTVTAIIPASKRDYVEHYSLYLTASLGAPVASIYTTPTVSLRISDDNGQTYWSPEDGDITLEIAEWDQELAWLSLGSFTAPGRVIEITDVGGMVRIDRADIDIEGEENG